MRFLTENDLRLLLDHDDITAYIPTPDTRLTPGARQYLLDRHVNLHVLEKKETHMIRESLTKEICCTAANPRQQSSGENLAGYNCCRLQELVNSMRAELAQTDEYGVSHVTRQKLLDLVEQLDDDIRRLLSK